MDSTKEPMFKADRLGIRARGQRWCGPDELPAGDTVAWAHRPYHDKAMEMGWDDTSTKGKGIPLKPNTKGNPITPDEYFEVEPSADERLHRDGYMKMFCPMRAEFVEQPRTRDRTTPSESMAKSREWQCWLMWFLQLEGATTGDKWQWVRPAQRENGWEWIARHAQERRMAHEGNDGRLFWRPPLLEQSPVLSTTVPFVPAHSPRVMTLGNFATRWNYGRRCRLVIMEKRRVEETTQYLNERCRHWRVAEIGRRVTTQRVVQVNPELRAGAQLDSILELRFGVVLQQ